MFRCIVVHETDARLDHVANCATEHAEEKRPELDASKWRATPVDPADFIISGDVYSRVDLALTAFEWGDD